MPKNPKLPATITDLATPLRAEEQVLSLHAEEIEVTKRIVAGDTVRVRKLVRSNDQLVQESLTHRRVEVTRVQVGRYVDIVPETRYEGDVTIMPVIEEVVVTERRLLLKEEIHIRQIEASEDYTQTITVRTEEALIERVPAPTVALLS